MPASPRATMHNNQRICALLSLGLLLSALAVPFVIGFGVGVLALAEFPLSVRFVSMGATGLRLPDDGDLRRLYLGLQLDRRKSVRRCGAARCDIYRAGSAPRLRSHRMGKGDIPAGFRGHCRRGGVAIRGRELVLAGARRG